MIIITVIVIVIVIFRFGKRLGAIAAEAARTGGDNQELWADVCRDLLYDIM